MSVKQKFEKLLNLSTVVDPSEIDKNVELLNKYLDLLNNSEQKYLNNVENIINSSIVQLKSQNDFKKSIRRFFMIFLSVFLSIEFICLFILLIFNKFLCISDAIIIAYISSVFVETISAILLMVKFSFDSQQEIQSLQILNNAIEKIQKL